MAYTSRTILHPFFCIMMTMTGLANTHAAAGAPDPFLKVDGLHIRNGHGTGDIVPLRGVNLGGWLLLEPWMCPMDTSGELHDHWSVRETLADRFGAAVRDSLMDVYKDAWLQPSDFDRIAALGMNVVRLPFWYVNVAEEDGTWKTNAFERMDWAIDQAWQRGIYTILDLHGVQGGQAANTDTTGRVWPTAALWTNPVYRERAMEIWRRVAAHYRGNPAVAGYDVLNEPIGVPNSATYWEFLDEVYQVIRDEDPDHIIIMEATYGHWNLSMLPNPADYGWTNVVYQLHVYPWDQWDSVNGVNQITDGVIQDWVNHHHWNVPCHIGEFNMGREASWRHAIEAYSEAGMGWQMWSYKATFLMRDTSWGIYNPHGNVGNDAVPNILTDSPAEIAAKWAQWTTDNAFEIKPGHVRTMAMPVAVDDTYTAVDGALTVAAPGVLENDTHMNLDGDGIEMQAQKVSDPLHGTVELNPDGSFTYEAEPGFTGVDTFRYRVWDGRIDSVRIANVSIDVLTGAGVGPAAQLVWTVEPGLATNGLAFAQQPVLQTADAFGNLSSSGLPEILDVAIERVEGSGILVGTTNINIGSAGSQGEVAFADLQIDGTGPGHRLRAYALTEAFTPTNLLLNGDFNEPESPGAPDHWTTWTAGGDGVWATREIPTKLQPDHPDYWPEGVGVYDGTYQMTFGAWASDRLAGAYQDVPVVAGESYVLSVDAGAENWWLPTGEFRIIWRDGNGDEIGRVATNTTDSLHDPDQYDVGVPYQSWSLTGVAPDLATEARIEFLNPVGTGSAWFNNADFRIAGDGVPSLSPATTAPFEVFEAPIPNPSISWHMDVGGPGEDTMEVRVWGAYPGLEYVLTATTNLIDSPVFWQPVLQQSFAPSDPLEDYTFSVTNLEPRLQYFRLEGTSP